MSRASNHVVISISLNLLCLTVNHVAMRIPIYSCRLLSNIPLWGSLTHWSLFIHSPFDGRLGCFQCSVVMNKASTNIHIYKSLCAISPAQTPECVIVGSDGEPMFNFITNCQTGIAFGLVNHVPLSVIMWLRALRGLLCTLVEWIIAFYVTSLKDVCFLPRSPLSHSTNPSPKL